MAKLLTGKEVVASMNEGVISRVGRAAGARCGADACDCANGRASRRSRVRTHGRQARRESRRERAEVRPRRPCVRKELLDVIERVNDDEGFTAV